MLGCHQVFLTLKVAVNLKRLKKRWSRKITKLPVPKLIQKTGHTFTKNNDKKQLKKTFI